MKKPIKTKNRLDKYKDFLDRLVDMEDESKTMFSYEVSRQLHICWELCQGDLMALKSLYEEKEKSALN